MELGSTWSNHLSNISITNITIYLVIELVFGESFAYGVNIITFFIYSIICGISPFVCHYWAWGDICCVPEFPVSIFVSKINWNKNNAEGQIDDSLCVHIFYLDEQFLLSPEETSAPLPKSKPLKQPKVAPLLV